MYCGDYKARVRLLEKDKCASQNSSPCHALSLPSGRLRRILSAQYAKHPENRDLG